MAAANGVLSFWVRGLSWPILLPELISAILATINWLISHRAVAFVLGSPFSWLVPPPGITSADSASNPPLPPYLNSPSFPSLQHQKTTFQAISLPASQSDPAPQAVKSQSLLSGNRHKKSILSSYNYRHRQLIWRQKPQPTRLFCRHRQIKKKPPLRAAS